MNDHRVKILTPLTSAILLICLSLGNGCATVGGVQGESLVPTRYINRTGPYEVATNFPISSTDPVMKGLQSLSHEVEMTLGVPIDAGDNPVKIYILGDRASFTHFLTIYYPELPQRRAFFLAQGTQRVVYTYNGDHLAVDLRHEATHALLNLAVGDLPIWLDEGLAEYFEVPTESHGLNQEHYLKLVQAKAEGFEPDLTRLERLTTVRDLAPGDYRESWLWVHSLLNGTAATRSVLMDYLADCRKTGTRPSSLSERLAANQLADPDRLMAHLDGASNRTLAVVAPSRDATVRLQSSALDATRPTRPKRGFFGTLGRFFFGQEPELENR